MASHLPYQCDRAATEAAYRGLRNHKASRCSCPDCKNFFADSQSAFPKAFLSLLVDLGIDVDKEVEVYRAGRNPDGTHSYAGWFHFIGRLNESATIAPVELENGFTYYMCHPCGPRLKPFEGLEVVQVEFSAPAIPWVVAQEEPQ